MKNYKGEERRRGDRINKNFIVSYRIYGDPNNIDISQTKNMGEGGIMLTTNCAFEPGTILAIEIKLPFVPIPIRLLGRVLESKEINRNIIYETRLLFTYLDDSSKSMISNTVDYFIKEEKNEKS